MRTVLFSAFLLFFVCGACTDSRPKGSHSKVSSDSSPYLNHHDSARYVGMQSCRSCHQDIYNTFLRTGMGKSFGLATPDKSAADFSEAQVYDRHSDLHYQALWRDDSMYMKEFRIRGRDTVHTRLEQVNFIIGSGQHTNSHLQSVNGYINQMPMTWYSQKGKWDLPPGFENGVNSRFSRKIGLECMTCHNAYPGFVAGSENKFTRVPGGIDCERCHGPGSIHVALRSTGSRVDTSAGPDFSIVNPGRLAVDAQFDICQRCHLQGNTILKEGKSFFDYRPGQKLSDFMTVFLPKYSHAEDEFIMASHADRLKQSPCFIKSLEKADKSNSARPYKNVMTCVTCHNPHVSVKETSTSVFNDACNKCHGNIPEQKARLAADHSAVRKNWTDCVSCHMPVSGSTDIPHVTIHDHFIRKPVSKAEKEKIREFLGLYAVNEKKPDRFTLARAYVNQYEKFEQEPGYLDSALRLLNGAGDDLKKIRPLVQIYFIRKQFQKVIAQVAKTGEDYCLDSLFVARTYDNDDAWTCYRVGEAFLYTGNNGKAVVWFRRCAELAPFNPDFRSKLGTTLAAGGEVEAAADIFHSIIAAHPGYTAAYTNLGYLKLLQGFPAEARRLYRIGEGLDPDNETLLLNIAAYYSFVKDKSMAKHYLQRVILLNPGNEKARAALRQIN